MEGPPPRFRMWPRLAPTSWHSVRGNRVCRSLTCSRVFPQCFESSNLRFGSFQFLFPGKVCLLNHEFPLSRSSLARQRYGFVIMPERGIVVSVVFLIVFDLNF